MSKYCVNMPNTLSEYLMLLNLEYFLNNNTKNNKKILIYKTNNDENILKKYDLKDHAYFSNKIISNLDVLDNTYKRMNITNLFLNCIITSKINININIANLFSQSVIARFMFSKQKIQKLLNDKFMILLHISNTSIPNIIYYILVIQCIFKFEAIKNGTDVTENKISIENDDIVFVVYTDEYTKSQNNLLSQQFLHQIALALPKLKSKLINGNKLFEEQIDYDGENYKLTKLVLYYYSYYVSIIEQNDLLFALSTYYNNSTTFLYPEKIIDNNFKQLIKRKISDIDYKTVTQIDEIDKRFINI